MFHRAVHRVLIVFGLTHVPDATTFGRGSVLSISPAQDMVSVVVNWEVPADVGSAYRAAGVRLDIAGVDGHGRPA